MVSAWGKRVRTIARPGPEQTERIRVAVLDGGTAAQIVSLPPEYGNYYRISVNEAVPIGLRAAVVRHLIETHKVECCTRDCEVARAWLPPQAAARTLPA